MSTLQELFETTLQDVLTSKDLTISSTDLMVEVTEMIPDLAEETAEAVLANIKKVYKSTIKANELAQRKFEKRHVALWEEPLKLLELLISIAREAGGVCNRRLRNDKLISSETSIEALTRLHARACQTSSAILVLLQSGYADDAHARWRSLHEIAVVGDFLLQGGDELAQRYLLHDAIQRYKLACALRDHAERINEAPLTQSEFDQLESDRNELISHFGKPFAQDYGWAASALGNKDPKLSNIEFSVKSNYWRPYYKMASANVHPNAHGIYFRLGLSKESDNALLAGPSTFGVTDPGHLTAVSLLNITMALLMLEPTLDDFVHLSILQRLADEVGEAFLQVHRKVEEQAKSHRATWTSY